MASYVVIYLKNGERLTCEGFLESPDGKSLFLGPPLNYEVAKARVARVEELHAA